MLDKKEYSKKQKDCVEAYMKLACEKAAELNLSAADMSFAHLVICGMTPWDALRKMINAGEYGEQAKLISITRALPAIMYRKLGQEILDQPGMDEYIDWAREVSQSMYALDLHRYDWHFEDSVNELRYLIELSHDQIERTGALTAQSVQNILQSIKELNAMYKFTGANSSFNVQEAKQVIFLGESNLED